MYYLFVLRDLFVCGSVDLGIEQYYLEQADGLTLVALVFQLVTISLKYQMKPEV